MVSAKYIFPILIGTGAMAQNQAVEAAINTAVKYMVKFKQNYVNDNQASAEASSILNGLVNYSGFQRIISDNLGQQLNKPQISAIVSSVSQAYDQFKSGPSFAPYTGYVKAHITDFDIQRGINNAEFTFRLFYPFIAGPIRTFLTDSLGRQIAQDVTNLAKEYAADVGQGRYITAIPNIPPPALLDEEIQTNNEDEVFDFEFWPSDD